jgi:hypothetical protein
MGALTLGLGLGLGLGLVAREMGGRGLALAGRALCGLAWGSVADAPSGGPAQLLALSAHPGLSSSRSVAQPRDRRVRPPSAAACCSKQGVSKQARMAACVLHLHPVRARLSQAVAARGCPHACCTCIRPLPGLGGIYWNHHHSRLPIASPSAHHCRCRLGGNEYCRADTGGGDGGWVVRDGSAAAGPLPLPHLQLRSSALGGYLIHLESMLSGMLHARAPSVPQHVVAAQRCGLSGGSGDSS